MSLAARDFFYIQQVELLARRALDDTLQSEGLTAGQYMALSLVVRHEPTSSASLARRARMTAQSMGEFIKALEYKGLVEKRSGLDNRRINHISSTPTGRKVLAQSDQRVDQAERLFFDCLAGDEYARFRQILGRLRPLRGDQTR